MQILRAEFEALAVDPASWPAEGPPEIAFAGRSNAGKSTAINTLAQQKRLAFASKTPGRTQHINLFELGPKDAADSWFAGTRRHRQALRGLAIAPSNGDNYAARR